MKSEELIVKAEKTMRGLNIGPRHAQLASKRALLAIICDMEGALEAGWLWFKRNPGEHTTNYDRWLDMLRCYTRACDCLGITGGSGRKAVLAW